MSIIGTCMWRNVVYDIGVREWELAARRTAERYVARLHYEKITTDIRDEAKSILSRV